MLEQTIVFEYRNVWYQIHAPPDNSWKYILLPNEIVLVHTNRISGPGEFSIGTLPIQALFVVGVENLDGEAAKKRRNILSKYPEYKQAEAILEPQFTLDLNTQFPEESRFIFVFESVKYEFLGYYQITRYILLPDGRILEHVGDRGEKYALGEPIQACGFKIKVDLQIINMPEEVIKWRYPLLAKAKKI